MFADEGNEFYTKTEEFMKAMFDKVIHKIFDTPALVLPQYGSITMKQLQAMSHNCSASIEQTKMMKTMEKMS